jgi:hypothetical protein
MVRQARWGVFMTATDAGRMQQFLIKTAESVARRSIPCRSEASKVGQYIAMWVLDNWGVVALYYDTESLDAFEVIEQVTRDALVHI